MERPTLDVENLEVDRRLAKKRAARMKRRIGGKIREANKIVSIFRHYQKRLLPRDWEDPSPYQCTYIFYVKYRKPQSELDILRKIMFG
jgi:hypothetical protein